MEAQASDRYLSHFRGRWRLANLIASCRVLEGRKSNRYLSHKPAKTFYLAPPYEHFESLIFDAPCGWESRNQTFGALTFQEEAKKHDRGASADARVERRVRKKERTPRFFTIKMAIAGGSSEARILS